MDYYFDGSQVETRKQKVTPKTPYKSQILLGSTFGEAKAPLGLDISRVRISSGRFHCAGRGTVEAVRRIYNTGSSASYHLTGTVIFFPKRLL